MWEQEQAGARLPVYIPPKNPPVVASSSSSKEPAPGQALSSGRGLIGRGPPSINYGTKSEECFLFHRICILMCMQSLCLTAPVSSSLVAQETSPQ